MEEGEEIIACGGVILYDFPPSYTNRSGKRAYIANMYTKEDYRGQGIAGQLLTKLISEVKELGISKVMLLASTMGKPVYRKFGFVEQDAWMELDI